MCKVIELRCGEQLTLDKKKSLWRITHVDDRWLPLLGWPPGMERCGRRRETLGAEQVFLLATVWKNLLTSSCGLDMGPTKTRDPLPPCHR